LTFEAYLVLIVIAVMFIALFRDAMRPGLVIFSAAVFLMVVGIITPDELVQGFSNKGMLTVAVLFLVSEGVRYSGALNKVAKMALPGQKRSYPRMLIFLMLPISAMSAFLNNTPVVIIFAPIIKKWAEKLKIAPAKFLIPLSYATILGGICTLIGTSTNLVVNGLMLDNGFEGLSMFELGKVGVVIAIAGCLYIAFMGHRLLPGPAKGIRNDGPEDVKEYYYNLTVTASSKYIGETVNHGKLKDNKDITVVAVERGHHTYDTQTEAVMLEDGDTLLVRGFNENVESLLHLDGLKLKMQGNPDELLDRENLHRIEVVLSHRFPGIGSTLEEFDFFSRYKGIVIAIHRNGASIPNNFTKERLRPGDLLVILADADFVSSWSDSKVFYLISSRGEVERPVKTSRVGLTLIILLLMILGATFGENLPTVHGNKPDMFFFATLAAVLMAILKIFPPKKYARAISLDVLITIASAFALSKALLNSGAAQDIAHVTINSVKQFGPTAVLAIIYLITMLFTEVITNNAAAALSFPIALSAANQLGVDPKPFFITICIASSASFATPIGYQANMIVQAIGGYKFNDFMKVGIPLSLIVFILSVTLIPYIWKF